MATLRGRVSKWLCGPTARGALVSRSRMTLREYVAKMVLEAPTLEQYAALVVRERAAWAERDRGGDLREVWEVGV